MSHLMTAIAMRQSGLKPSAKIVLYWLADHHNGETGDCFPSLKTLAAECEMDIATVKRQLLNLEEIGLICRSKRHRKNGSQTSTQYVLTMADPLAQNAPPPSAKCATPLAQNVPPHNLGNNNLGNKPVIKTKAKKSEIDFQSVVDAWNSKAEKHKMPKVQLLTEPRKTAIKARVADIGGVGNLIEAIERVFLSNFLTGQTNTPFKATFDWATKSSNFIKIVEGNYDNEKSTNNRNGGNPQAMGNTSKTAEIANFAAKYAARRAANSGNGGTS